MSFEKINETINNIKKKFNSMMKNKHFKKQEKFSEWKSNCSKELNECAGELNTCKELFAITARTSATAVQQGREECRNTSLQEDELRNAVVGYLTMDDAIFTLNSLNTYDALTRAYEDLTIAEERMKGKRAKQDLHTFLRRPERKGVQGVLDSEEQEAENIKIYEAIKEELITSKNIELTVKNYRKRTYEEKKKGGKPDTPPTPPAAPPAPDSAEAVHSNQLYESDEERQQRIEHEKSRSFDTAPPEIKKKGAEEE